MAVFANIRRGQVILGLALDVPVVVAGHTAAHDARVVKAHIRPRRRDVAIFALGCRG